MSWWARAAAAASAAAPPPPWRVRARRGAWLAIKAGAALHVGFNYVAFFSSVNGPSMFPTFTGRGWNVVVAEALPGVQDRVRTGDVVICVRPVNPRESVIKRVAAVAGDTVTLYTARGGGGPPARVEVRPFGEGRGGGADWAWGREEAMWAVR